MMSFLVRARPGRLPARSGPRSAIAWSLAACHAWRIRVVGLMALLLLCLFAAVHASAEQKYLEPEQAFSLSATMASPTEIDIRYKIAPGYYMYRERFELALSPDAQRLGTPVYPKGIVKYDPNFDKEVEIFHDQVLIKVPLKPGATAPQTLDVTGQGCAEAGLCYPPMTTALTLHPTATGYTVSGPGAQAGVARGGAAASTGNVSGFDAALHMGDTGIAKFLAGAGWGEIILLCVVFGVLLSFTPCVLPMVPILLAIVAGGANTRATVSRWRGLSLAAAYVLGMSLVYTALGIAAGLIGASLSAWLQTPWVLTLFAVLLALLALAMFDVFTFQAPGAFQSALSEKVSRIPGGRAGAAFLMGMISALIVGPCVAAPLAGVLLFISQTGNVVLGGVALFSLAWGQGVLLLLVGGSSGALLPKAGGWMDGVKHLFGVLLFATAWWMVNSIMPDWLAALGWAVLAAWCAVMLGAFEPMGSEAGQGTVLRKAAGLLLALWSALIVVGLAVGGHDVWQPLRVLRPAVQASLVAVAPSSTTPSPVAATSPVGTTTSAGTATPPAPFAPPASTASPVASASASASSATSGALTSALTSGFSLAKSAAATAGRFTRVASSAELDALLARTTRPVMLDFYADWCVSCIEMEKFTFSDPQVAARMSKFLLVQADVTKNNADDRALLKRFQLFGPPGIMFFDAHGKLITDARVVGFQDATKFSAELDRVLAASGK